jgi:hypothetical protein
VKVLDNMRLLVFEEADNAYMTFVTTDGSEAVKFDKALDINAATQIDATVTVGVDDTGYDVKFFGATAGAYMLWDESADTLEVSGTVVAAAGTALLPSITTTGDLNTGMWFPAADTIAFSEGGVEALRIDSSGNLLVGTTDSNPTSSAVNVAGQSFSTTGGVRSTVASNPAATFNRKTDDGDIAIFRKDGTTVGSIGTLGSTTYFSGVNSGLRMDTTIVVPTNASGTNLDASLDLGAAGVRFKDLYLSGGVYLGGTGAANHLDDYEEATWTPTIEFGGASVGITYDKQLGHYTKIGRMVYASFDILLSNKGSSTGGVTIIGLPIANYGTHQNNAGTVICEGGGVDWPQNGVYGMVWTGGTIYLRQQGLTSYAAVTNSYFSNTTKIFGMMVYEATS